MSSFDVTLWHVEERKMKEGDERERENKKTRKKNHLTYKYQPGTTVKKNINAQI